MEVILVLALVIGTLVVAAVIWFPLLAPVVLFARATGGAGFLERIVCRLVPELRQTLGRVQPLVDGSEEWRLARALLRGAYVVLAVTFVVGLAGLLILLVVLIRG